MPGQRDRQPARLARRTVRGSGSRVRTVKHAVKRWRSQRVQQRNGTKRTRESWTDATWHTPEGAMVGDRSDFHVNVARAVW